VVRDPTPIDPRVAVVAGKLRENRRQKPHAPQGSLPPLIRLEHVGKRYPNGRVALEDLDLGVDEGELVVLVGPSGCGKTTTLRLINRLIEPTAGRVLVGGEDVATKDPVTLRRKIGYVIQQVGLFPHLTIGNNVATVPRLLGWDKRAVRTRVDELLQLVGLEPSTYRDRYPHELSGGQQQRVGVARALGADPPVLLMDEPFGALDPVTRARLQDELLAIQADVRKTIVFVTHDIDEAVKLGDRIALFGDDHRVQQYGTPMELLAHPASDFVVSFIGEDRGLKLLSVTAITADRLRPAGPADLDPHRPRVAASATLRDALTQMVVRGVDRVTVVDGANEVVGVLTIDALAAVERPD
jgi:osmoprotectant transport system ATP-binding protein